MTQSEMKIKDMRKSIEQIFYNLSQDERDALLQMNEEGDRERKNDEKESEQKTENEKNTEKQ